MFTKFTAVHVEQLELKNVSSSSIHISNLINSLHNALSLIKFVMSTKSITQLLKCLIN